MATGRESCAFARSSMITFLLADIRRLSCDPKHAPKAMKLEDFNPYAEKQKPLRVDISALKSVFIKKKKKPCPTPSAQK